MAELAETWILTLLIALPIVGAVVVGLTESREADEASQRRIRRTAMGFAIATAALGVLAIILFFQATDRSGGSLAEQGRYALCLNRPWISDEEIGSQATRGTGYIDFRYNVGVDGISLWLVVLTAGITPLALWSGFASIRWRLKEYHVLMLLLEAGMIGVFCARDLLLFYIFFEFTLIPLYFIIGVWGGPKRRQAASKFFIYTFAGSVLTFAGVLFLAYQAYSLPASRNGVGVFTFDLETLYALRLSSDVQWWLFLAFAAGFAIKVPLFPLHTWLPLAHTEAPTAGSVLLAAVLLKLGTYGFLRFSVPMLPDATVAFAPIMAILAIGGILCGALAAWVQEDIKKLIAYSSVSHLGFCMLGMFSLKSAGLVGSVMYMVNHGLSTGALFLVVGMIYERYHTRRFDQLGGLARPMPWMAFFLIFFTLSSIGLPGLNGFVAEFLVLLGTMTSNADGTGPLGIFHAAFAALGIILGAIYMLYLCQRVLFGPLREPAGTPDTSTGLSRDLNGREIGILAPVAAACLILGVWPDAILSSIRPATEEQVLAWVQREEGSGFRVQGSVGPARLRQRALPPRAPSSALEGPGFGVQDSGVALHSDETGVTRLAMSNSPVFPACQRPSCPRGAQVCSQGRKPLVQIAPRQISPEGAEEGLIHSQSSVAPLGLIHQCDTGSRGLRPWLHTFAPAGAMWNGAFDEFHSYEAVSPSLPPAASLLTAHSSLAPGSSLIPHLATASRRPWRSAINGQRSAGNTGGINPPTARFAVANPPARSDSSRRGESPTTAGRPAATFISPRRVAHHGGQACGDLQPSSFSLVSLHAGGSPDG